MTCKTVQNHNNEGKTIQLSCEGECNPVYKKDANNRCDPNPVSVHCLLVTPVEYSDGSYKPKKGSKTECKCVIMDEDDNCRKGLTVKKNKKDKTKIEEVNCGRNECTTYYTTDKCTVKAATTCTLVIDHTNGNIVRCVCIRG